MDKNLRKISTKPYKGVRDFYPEDMAVQKYLFAAMSKTAELFGYVEYNASVLEPTDLYKAKSGDEIVNEQTYSFKDRGDRDVTLRPEMTPTVARMVAARKRELGFPLRWYSIPNLFRYEKPQRGRLREHFQLNVDIFGVESTLAESELVILGSALMKEFGATPDMFTIKINNRKILNSLFENVFKLSENQAITLRQLIDKKNKIEPKQFVDLAREIVDNDIDLFLGIMAADSLETFTSTIATAAKDKIAGLIETKELMKNLQAAGITNVVFDPTLARGFDYYTDTVFEFFDIDKTNPRSIFGGGRYDDLLSIFGTDKVPAVGFGLGDVTLRDFLETHDLLPEYRSSTNIYICQASAKDKVADNTILSFISKLAADLRSRGINLAIDFSGKKIADQIRTADKQKIPYIVVIGSDEAAGGLLTLKELASGVEHGYKSAEHIAEFIKNTA